MAPSVENETNEMPPLWLSLGEQLNALLSASRAVAAEMAASFDADLPPAAYHIIQWLHAFGPAQASHVADALAMDRSATSRLVRQLKQAGIVESRPDPADKRGVLLSLTDQGSNKMRAAIKHKGEVFRRRLDGWSEADLRLFTALLRRFNTGMAD
ncbi:DNA-binding MarR family transcriptional regulator [Bradyrhizobium sp. USDA 4011]